MRDKFDEINYVVSKVSYKAHLEQRIPNNIDLDAILGDAVEEGIKIGRRNALAEIAEGLLKKQFDIECNLGSK